MISLSARNHKHLHIYHQDDLPKSISIKLALVYHLTDFIKNGIPTLLQIYDIAIDVYTHNLAPQTT